MLEELADDIALPKAKRRRKHKGKKDEKYENSEAATHHTWQLRRRLFRQ
jgi:hypothetical protein